MQVCLQSLHSPNRYISMKRNFKFQNCWGCCYSLTHLGDGHTILLIHVWCVGPAAWPGNMLEIKNLGLTSSAVDVHCAHRACQMSLGTWYCH